MIEFPNIDPVAFSIGPFAVRWYALAYIAGLIFAIWYAKRLVSTPKLWAERKPTLTPQQVDDLFIWITLGVILGGRIGYVLFYNPLHFLMNPLDIFRMWEGGMQSHRGRHYQVEKARIYDLPDRPPPVIISGFGPKATKLAARIGDGFCTVSPVKDAVESFRRDGGAGKVVAGGMKACYSSQEARARATVHRLWPNEALPGELSQILPTPAHFEQACEIVSEEMTSESVPCGPDIERHVSAVQAYADAGFDELYVGQVGDEQEAFFEAYSREVLPRFARSREPSRDDGPGRTHALRA